MARPDAANGAVGAEGALASWSTPILIYGCGNMAGAILGRWLDCGLPPPLVTIVNRSPRAVPDGVTMLHALPTTVAPGTLVMLGFKPQNLTDLAPAVDAMLALQGGTILSMLAGITSAQLAGIFPHADGIVRIMPNLPVRTGAGVVLYHGAAPEPLAIGQLLGVLGLVEPLDDERDFDLATAVSGCGPAFVYRFIDALAKSGEALGLDSARAARLAVATVAGAAATAAASPDEPALLADRVASPGGMTREGMNILDADGRLNGLLVDTLRAARDRGAVLAGIAATS